MAADKEVERLRSVIAVLEKELEGTQSIAELRAQERDEWKAHAERLTKAADRLTFGLGLDGWEPSEFTGHAFSDLMDIMVNEPKNSLALLVAHKQAEALERLHDESKGAVTIARGTLIDRAREYRRQAESQP